MILQYPSIFGRVDRATSTPTHSETRQVCLTRTIGCDGTVGPSLPTVSASSYHTASLSSSSYTRRLLLYNTCFCILIIVIFIIFIVIIIVVSSSLSSLLSYVVVSTAVVILANLALLIISPSSCSYDVRCSYLHISQLYNQAVQEGIDSNHTGHWVLRLRRLRGYYARHAWDWGSLGLVASIGSIIAVGTQSLSLPGLQWVQLSTFGWLVWRRLIY